MNYGRTAFHLSFVTGVAAFLALALLLLAPPASSARQDGGAVPVATALRLSTPEEIKDEFAAVPCRNGERLAAAQALFERMGAPASAVSVEKLRGGVENLVVRKEGAGGDELLVVGAHYDIAEVGCGAVDNWTGVVALAHLYRTLRDVRTRKTVLFVAFGKEERGLVGSGAMVDAIPKEELPRFCAMVNLDSFGLANPQALDNASSAKLVALAAELAKELKMPFTHARVGGADSDSSSFVRKKIPAVTLHGLSGDYERIIHTTNDKPARVNTVAVYLGYRLTLSLVAKLDESACQAFR